MRRLLRRPTGDRGSMALLFLVIAATMALGAIMLTSVIGQSRSSRFTQSRVHDLDAAQAGIDVVLGQVRMAVASDGTGDDGQLPCGPWNGDADADSNGTYQASIAYYLTDPSVAGATQMRCTSAGPFDPASQSRTARYAVITSTGVDGSADSGGSQGRTLQATYVFQVNDQNFAGGQIRIYPAGSSQFCMDAGSSPAVGTPILLRSCSTSAPPAASQLFAYRSDLSIELVSSARSSTPLCIDTSPTAHASSDAMVLNRCSVVDASVCPSGYTPTTYAVAYPGKSCAISSYNQQWSVDDNAHLEGAKTDRSDIDGFCITVASQISGAALTLQSCQGGTQDTAQTWIPSPTAGAGMAGAGNQQLVNYKQFATCVDITGQNPSSAFEILYSCKQNPNPSNIRWNQRFVPSPALGTGPTQTLLKVTNGGTTYCLQSPRTVGGYPMLKTPCPLSVSLAGTTSGYVWTVDRKYSDNAGTVELSYADKYTIKDDAGQCLGLGANSDLFSSVYYKAVVTTCDGSTSQKWNADPSLDAAVVTNVHEN